METEKGEGGAVRVRGAETVDVVRVSLFALRFYVGDCAFQVGAKGEGWGVIVAVAKGGGAAARGGGSAGGVGGLRGVLICCLLWSFLAIAHAPVPRLRCVS